MGTATNGLNGEVEAVQVGVKEIECIRFSPLKILMLVSGKTDANKAEGEDSADEVEETPGAPSMP